MPSFVTLTPLRSAGDAPKGFRGKATVVLATYQERENLEPLVVAIRAALTGREFGIVVVDDASPDGTGEIADRLAAADPRIAVVHRATKLGLGSAIRTGIEHALAEGAEVVVTMDADFSHPPAVLPRLLDALADADVGIGSRYIRGGGVTGWPLHRRLLSRAANALTQALTGSRMHDNTGNFRAVTRSALLRLDLRAIQAEGYSWLIEFTYYAQRRGLRFVEVPFVFVNRTAGISKISRGEVLRAFIVLLLLSRHRIRA